MNDTLSARLSSNDLPHYALVVLVAAVLMFSNLGLPSLDNHEALVAVTARTMTEPDHWLDAEAYSGSIPPNTQLNHWLVPIFNGQPRLVKTPLAYWLVAGSVRLGLPMNEFSSRLPSAISAVLASVIVLMLGRKVMSSRAALLAALMFASSLGLFAWGKNARPEMFLCLSMTATMACLYFGIHSESSGRRHVWLIAAWLATGIGNLSKEFVPLFLSPSIILYLGWRGSLGSDSGNDDGTRQLLKAVCFSLLGLSIAAVIQAFPALHWWNALGLPIKIGKNLCIIALAGIPLAWFCLRYRVHRQLAPLLPTALPGAVLMLSMFVPWLWYMGSLFPETGAILSGQVLERGLGEMGLKHGLKDQLSGIMAWYYLVALVKYTAPWTVLLPCALAIPFMKRFHGNREGLIFLFCWVFGLLLLLSSAEGKRQHYILPALPALCLLMGVCLDDMFFRHKWFGIRTAGAFLGGSAGVFLLIAAVSLLSPKTSLITKAQWQHIFALSAALAALLAVGFAALRRERRSFALVSLFASAVLGWILYASEAPLWDRDLDRVLFTKKAAEAVPPHERVASITEIERQMVYYFGRDILPAEMRLSMLTKEWGPEPGRKKWEEWMRSDNGPKWVFGLKDQKDELVRLGFIEIFESEPSGSRGKEQWVLFRKA